MTDSTPTLGQMFRDRFEGSLKPPGSRQNLAFAEENLMRLGPLKDEWDFIENQTLRSNIAAELQKVHLDILLLNNLNIYYSPEAMTMKHSIIACASVAEAVLEVAVKRIENDPRVQPILEAREYVFEEFRALTLTGFDVPAGREVVAGVRREIVRSRLDRNTKMQLLIRAAKAGEVIDEAMAKKVDHLRSFRNRVHIKTVEELEYFAYKHFVTNRCIDILEEFRVVAKAWFEAQRATEFQQAVADLAPAQVFAREDEFWEGVDDDELSWQ
jgi:hypothetical protein